MDLFRFDPPDLDEDEVARIADSLYGLTGTTQRLRGERSLNTRFTTADGEDFVLRIASASEPGAAIECQALALVHLETMAPQLPVVRMRVSHNGQLVPTVEIRGNQHRVRLETYLPGITFREGEPISLDGLRAIGELLGGVAAALLFFEHPAAYGFMPWDIANGLVVDESLHAALPAEAGALAQRAAGRVDSAMGWMRRLPRQIVHNDGHAGNLLRTDEQSDRVTGLIDFGDLVHTVTAADIAVSAASLVPRQRNPVDALAALTSGYHTLRPLTGDEVAAIPDLIVARLVLSVLLNQYQIDHTPHLATAAAEERPGLLDSLARWLEVDAGAASERIAEGL